MDLGNYWWVPVVAAAIGGFLVPFIGYFKRQRQEASQSTIRGVVMMDSSIGRDGIAVGEDIAVSLRRVADALDKKVSIEAMRDKRREDERHELIGETQRRTVENLERKIEELEQRLR